jgi:hypothetical protein
VSAAALLRETSVGPDLPLALAARLAPGSVFEGLNESLCPVCEHPFEAHRQVYPWDDPPLLLCFLMVDGRRCFTECGACRRDLA